MKTTYFKDISGNWSEDHYTGLTKEQHKINNKWFQTMMETPYVHGFLYVPDISTTFVKKSEKCYYTITPDMTRKE